MKNFSKAFAPAVLLAALFMLCAERAEAQKFRDSTLVKIVTVDDNEFVGKILSQNDTEFRINSETLGPVSIPKLKIKSIEKVDKDRMIGGELWDRSPQESRYFFGPSGYGLHEGEGYYQNTGLFLNQMGHGLTDNFTIGGGIMPFPFFSPVWFTPKVSFPYKSGNGSAAVGLLYINYLGWGNDFSDGSGRWGGAGMVYGCNTWGSRDRQLTFGMGYGFADGDGWANYPTFMLSAMQRTRKRMAFISENYVIPIDGGALGILSAGGRFLGKNVTVDFGLWTAFESDYGFVPGVFPWYSVAFPWQSQTKEKEKK